MSLHRSSFSSTAAALGALLVLVSSAPVRAQPPAGGPVVLEAQEKEEVEPPRRDAPSNKLALAGGLFFGTSYVISVIAASVSMTKPGAQLPELYAPVAGPWIAIPNMIQIEKHTTGGDPAAHNVDFLKPVGLGILGIAQGIGVLCLTGYFVERYSPSDKASSSVRVVPYVGVTSAGLTGSF